MAATTQVRLLVWTLWGVASCDVPMLLGVFLGAFQRLSGLIFQFVWGSSGVLPQSLARILHQSGPILSTQPEHLS